jgi:amino acid adenylation domain-containing protein
MSDLAKRIAALNPKQRELLQLKLANQDVNVLKATSITRRAQPVAPLSFAQQRLWFLDQLEPGSAAYNISLNVTLSGKLDSAALLKSLNELTRRHEIFRTTFAVVNDEPAQIISTTLEMDMPIIDLSHLPDAEREREARRLAAAEARRPFDLSRLPLLRAALLRLSETEHLILLTLHHIISDGWSMSVLIKEVAALYEAYRRGEQSPLPELAVQYGDYAVWQREWLAGEVLEQQLAYWREQLSGATQLELPTDRPRPPVQSFRGAHYQFVVEEEVWSGLREMSQREGVTVFMVLLAAFKVLLSRYTGQRDIVVGTPIAGRTRTETEALIGLFVNTLVLRTKWTGEVSFRELMREVREGTLEAYAHQELPFEKLVEQLQPERSLSRTPLFQVMFVLQNVPQESLELAGLNLHLLQVESGMSKFDITLSMLEGDDELYGSFEYSTDLFEEATIARMAGHFQNILRHVVSAPHQLVSDIPLLSAPELHQLLVERNNTSAPYPYRTCLHELFEAQVKRTPDSPALTFADQTLTYRELNARANQLAHHLRGLGAAPEQLIAILMERSSEMVVSLLAVLKAGAAYLPLDPAYPAQRLSYMLADSGASLLLTQEELLPRLPEHEAQVIVVERKWSEISKQSEENPPLVATPDNLAYVIYTSGSTGQPKGVMIHHRPLVNYLHWCSSAYQLHLGAGAPLHSPLAFDLTVTSLWSPLLAGRPLLLVAEGAPLEGLAHALQAQHDFSLVKVTPAHLEALRQYVPPAAVAHSTRLLVIGGEALHSETLRWWREHAPHTRLINEYGPTETVVGCSVYEVTEQSAQAGAVPIGRPIANARLYVLDERQQAVAVGVKGEIYIGGEGVGRGYLGRAELTAERFVPDPYGERAGGRMYRTGDVGRWSAAGELEYVGRNDGQVKVRGYRVELGEVESELGRVQGVREAAVVVREDEGRGKELIGYVVVEEGSGIAGSGMEGEEIARAGIAGGEIRRRLRERMPEYMVPGRVVVLEAMPLTPNGKLDRQALAASNALSGDAKAEYVAPRTPTEESLAAIWANVTGIEQVGIHDSFFDLGGDSIRSVRAVALAKTRGIHFTVQQLFRNQTIAGLVHELSFAEASPTTATLTAPFSMISAEDRLKLPEDVEDAYPLAMMQSAMLYHMELTPEAPAYHNVNSWHLRGAFDVEAMREAVRQVVARHPVLRTSFDLTKYSRALQLVHRDAPLPFEVYDIRHLSFDEQEKVLAAFLEAERMRLFDLSRPPLMRFFAHRRSEETFQFSLTECHPIIDGWSTTSTLAEMAEYYFTLVNHEAPPHRPPLIGAYRDFINLELQALASSQSRSYWTEKLSEGTPVKLPRWAASTKSGAGEKGVVKYMLPIEPELLEQLRHVAQSLAVPLKTVAFAAHLKVMSMVTGLNDLLAGITFNGRPEEEDGINIRGNFLNTVPFRFRFFSGTWAEIIKAVFEAEWALLPHRRYPLGVMQRQWGREPLVETCFVYLHFHSVEGIMKPGKFELVGSTIDLSETNFNLQTIFMLNSTTANKDAWIELQFDAAHTCAEQREAMRAYYDQVLHAIAADTSVRHESQSYLTPTEQRQLLEEWNGTSVPWQTHQCVHQLFAAQAARTPHAPAVSLLDQQLTYRELNERANQVAALLRRKGVGLETRVGLYVERSVEMVVGLLGVLKAGGAYVPLEASNPAERLKWVIEDAELRVVLTQGRLRERLPAGAAEVICLDEGWDESGAQGVATVAAEAEEVEVWPESLAYIIYTSGSTGMPKGTLITHRGLMNYLNWCVEAYQVEQGDGSLVHSSISFDLTVTGLYAPLMVGRKVELLPEDVGIESLQHAIKKSGNLSLVKITPAHLQLLSQRLAPEDVAGKTRAFVIGGENLLGETLRFWQESAPDMTLINEYGPTETVVGCCVYRVPAGTQVAGSVPIGWPIANTQLYVLDSFGQLLPVEAPGELYIGGAGVARGYLNRPDLTAEKFVPDPFGGVPGARLYRTGDLVCRLPDGSLEFLGRLDQQVKILGYRIEIGEVEAALKQHPSVAEVYVMAYEEKTGIKRLAAYLVESNAPAPTTEDLRAFVKEKLPDYMVPSVFIWLSALPLSASGKVDRRALPAPDPSHRHNGKAYVAPQSETEIAIAAVWQEVLEVAEISRDDNFFDLGGDSFRVYEVHTKLRARLPYELSILDLFRYPTIETLARHFSEQTAAGTSFQQTQDRAARRQQAANRRKKFAGERTNING